jgi:uncharacterized OsmC-like protein/predicted GNAT family N-acyltransferase
MDPVLTARHKRGRLFEVTGKGGVVAEADGHHVQALSPMDMLVASLTTCSAITVLDLLAKMRQPVLSMEVAAQGERSEGKPRLWRKIHLEYRIEGVFDQERAHRAVELSETKHCPVAAMLSGSVEITHTIERVGADIRRIAADDTYALRQSLLRPHQNIDEMNYPGDLHPDTVHFGAYLDGTLVGIASLYQEQPADWPLMGRGFKLRGMATTPEARGLGLGSALLRTCHAHARVNAASAVWCSARLNAEGFYSRHGFVRQGDPFDLPAIGPHVLMVCRLSAAG